MHPAVQYSRVGVNALENEPARPSERAFVWKIKCSAYRTHATLCVGLHAILVLIHAILLLICARNWEHAWSFELTPFSLEWYPLAATTFMQIFGTLFLAVLVATTQSLAFRSDLYVRQTLTALHDKSNAWLGLGAACTSLWGQFKLRTAMGGVAYITAYLLGVWALHVTIPTVLNVVPYNATVPTVNKTILANVTTPSANFATAYDILLFSDQVPTLGLQENMVYDIIPVVPSANGSTKVNASMYDVDCAALPQVGPSGDTFLSNGGGLPDTQMLQLYLDAEETDIYAATAPYGAPAIYTGQPLVISTGCNQGPRTGYHPGACWVPIFVLSTIAIVDGTGAQPPVPGTPWISIDPLVTVVPYPAANPAVFISGVQLLACSVQITNATIDVSVETRTPLNPPPKPRTDTLWRNWTWPDDLTLMDQLRAAQNVPYFSPPSGHSTSLTVAAGLANLTDGAPPLPLPGYNPDRFEVDPPEDNVFVNTFLNESSSVTVVPTAFDIFLAEDLRLTSQNRTTVTVAEINHSMAKALAAVAWYGNNVHYSSPHATERLVQPQSAYVFGLLPNMTLTLSDPAKGELYGEATIIVIVQRLRLNLSLFPILAGLVASIGLLVLCVIVIRVPASARAAFDPRGVVDSGGLLQYTWLLGTEPHLAAVETPVLENLRAAGLFDIEVSERTKKHQIPTGGAEKHEGVEGLVLEHAQSIRARRRAGHVRQ